MIALHPSFVAILSLAVVGVVSAAPVSRRSDDTQWHVHARRDTTGATHKSKPHPVISLPDTSKSGSKLKSSARHGKKPKHIPGQHHRDERERARHDKRSKPSVTYVEEDSLISIHVGPQGFVYRTPTPASKQTYVRRPLISLRRREHPRDWYYSPSRDRDYDRDINRENGHYHVHEHVHPAPPHRDQDFDQDFDSNEHQHIHQHIHDKRGDHVHVHEHVHEHGDGHHPYDGYYDGRYGRNYYDGQRHQHDHVHVHEHSHRSNDEHAHVHVHEHDHDHDRGRNDGHLHEHIHAHEHHRRQTEPSPSSGDRGVPGKLDLVSSDMKTYVASLMLSEVNDTANSTDDSRYILSASNVSYTQFWLSSAPSSSNCSSPADMQTNEVPIRLSTQLFDRVNTTLVDYCAAYFRQSNSTESMTIEPCEKPTNRTHCFAYNTETNVVRPFGRSIPAAATTPTKRQETQTTPSGNNVLLVFNPDAPDAQQQGGDESTPESSASTMTVTTTVISSSSATPVATAAADKAASSPAPAMTSSTPSSTMAMSSNPIPSSSDSAAQTQMTLASSSS